MTDSEREIRTTWPCYNGRIGNEYVLCEDGTLSPQVDYRVYTKDNTFYIDRDGLKKVLAHYDRINLYHRLPNEEIALGALSEMEYTESSVTWDAELHPEGQNVDVDFDAGSNRN